MSPDTLFVIESKPRGSKDRPWTHAHLLEVSVFYVHGYAEAECGRLMLKPLRTLDYRVAEYKRRRVVKAK